MAGTSNKPDFTIKKYGSQASTQENFRYRAKEDKARAMIIAYLANSAFKGGEPTIGKMGNFTVFKKLPKDYGIQKFGQSYMRVVKYERWLEEMGNAVDQHFKPRLDNGETWDEIYHSMRPRYYGNDELCLTFA